MSDLSIDAAEAMPLESASNRDAASDRDASMRQLEKISAMAKALTAERLLLGTRAADKKRRQELDEEFEVIRSNAEHLRWCIDGDDYLCARRDGASGGARKDEAAAAKPVPRQQQPDKSKAFKMPETKLFPPWSTTGRSEPLDLRRWFLGAERVCETHRLEVSEWGRVVALILPTGVHQDWIYRYLEANTGAGWDKLVEDFVTAFQQQTSMDILEAECMGSPPARYAHC